MAKKGFLNLNISNCDNILEEILKHGKIPVIRISDKGFQNYKQDNYFNRYEKENCLMYWSCSKSRKEILKGKRPEKGCFVCLGGVQGSYVTGSHDYEDIHIGYLEPDTKVFITYVSENSKLKPFSYVSAKERFEDTLRYFDEIKDSEEIDLDDFDVLSEAIVDSKDVYKVAIIKDEKVLFKSTDDSNFLKVVPEEVLFNRIVHKNVLMSELDSEFYKSIEKERVLKLSYLGNWNFEYHFFDMIETDSLYRKLLFKACKEYSLYGSLNNCIHDYLNDLEYLEKVFTDSSLFRVSRIFFNPNQDFLSIKISLNRPFCSKKDDFFGFFNGDVLLHKSGQKIEFSYNDTNNCFEKISLKDLLKPSFRAYLFKLLDFYDEYVKVVSKYTTFVESEFLKFLKIFRDTDKFLNGYQYFLDLKDYTYKLSFSNSFILEYNFILNDFVLELGNNFYNIETLPKDDDLCNFIFHFKDFFEIKFSDLNKNFILT